MQFCSYGCNQIGHFVFKNGKHCCSRRTNLCPAIIAKGKTSIKKIDPDTGLNALEKRTLKMNNTVDPATGLTKMQIKGQKARESNLRINPVTGMTKLQESHRRLATVDPSTGESKKSKQAKDAIKRLKNEIDETTGLSKWKLSRIQSRNSYHNRTPEQKKQTANKRKKFFDTVNPESGLTLKKEIGIKTSKILTTVDPVTGQTPAKLRALKNLANKSWLTNVSRGKASKESLALFDPLIDYCDQEGIKWYCGTRGCSEWWLKTQEGKVKFFDFVITDLRIIIEYHGEVWHPNPNKLTEEQWLNWRAPGTILDAATQHNRDLEKIALANSHGFEVIVVWSSDNIESAISHIRNLISHKKMQVLSCFDPENINP